MSNLLKSFGNAIGSGLHLVTGKSGRSRRRAAGMEVSDDGEAAEVMEVVDSEGESTMDGKLLTFAGG